MRIVLLAPRRWRVAALCGVALALASITPVRAAEAMRESTVRPPEPIQRHYDDVNYIARHASVMEQREVRLAVLRAPGSKPPPHLREIGDRIARVEAAIAEVDTGIVSRSPPTLTGYAPTEVVAIKGAAPLLKVRVRVTDLRGQTRDEVHVWEQTPLGWIRRAGAFVLLDR
jgi:hypothetical protein